jgi:hypothetical protein
MNSSTSGSDARRWRRWLRTYAIATLAGACGLGALVLAIDPYDTGRFALLPARGVPDFGQRLSFASVAREPDINGAIFGNSTIQLLDPARLSRLTGRNFVSLAVPGTGPREQLAIADWFRRTHRNVSLTYVFGIDASWCTTQDPIPLTNPFPFWLYSARRLDYSAGMMSYRSIEASIRKLKMLLGRERTAARDGYHDYDTGHAWHGIDLQPGHTALQAQGPSDDAAPEKAKAQTVDGTSAEELRFTAPPLLDQFLRKLGPGAQIVLVEVPRYAGILPRTAAEARPLDACKAAYRAIAEARPGTVVLDFLVDNEMTRDDKNFWDGVHYRGPIARVLEQKIASSL